MGLLGSSPIALEQVTRAGPHGNPEFTWHPIWEPKNTSIATLASSVAIASSHCDAKARKRPCKHSLGHSLVDLFHLGGLVRGPIDLLKRRQVVVVAEALIVVIDAQAKLDHPVDAPGELRGLLQREPGGE